MELQNGTKSLENWEEIFETEIKKMTVTVDPAHDHLHLKRVVKTAKYLASKEKADLRIVVPAAWLHDFVVIPKNSPLRRQASRISATRALEFLENVGYPSEFYPGIAHAIQAHSFSAAIAIETIEAAVVQDADRLDGLGAIGLARCFITAGQLGTCTYSELDPFCRLRAPDDSQFTVDHFYIKLFRIAETLQTKTAQEEGFRRVNLMKDFLQDLSLEI